VQVKTVGAVEASNVIIIIIISSSSSSSSCTVCLSITRDDRSTPDERRTQLYGESSTWKISGQDDGGNQFSVRPARIGRLSGGRRGEKSRRRKRKGVHRRTVRIYVQLMAYISSCNERRTMCLRRIACTGERIPSRPPPLPVWRCSDVVSVGQVLMAILWWMCADVR